MYIFLQQIYNDKEINIILKYKKKNQLMLFLYKKAPVVLLLSIQ